MKDRIRADLRAGVLRELRNDAARQIARVDLPLKDLVQPPDAGDGFAAAFVLVVSLGNAPFLLILRHNRLRIARILDREGRKT